MDIGGVCGDREGPTCSAPDVEVNAMSPSVCRNTLDRSSPKGESISLILSTQTNLGRRIIEVQLHNYMHFRQTARASSLVPTVDCRMRLCAPWQRRG